MEHDLWYTKVNCSTNNRAWAFGFWLEETVDITEELNGQIVAEAVNAHFQTQLVGCLSVDSRLESIECWRRFPSEARPGCVLSQNGIGTVLGRSLSNDNALYVNLRQEDEDARFNGGLYLAGQSENNATHSLWDPSYLTDTITPFTDRFGLSIVAVSPNGGSWAVVVLSKKFTPPATPIGTPFEVVSAVAANRVLSQRRRRQKVRGWND